MISISNKTIYAVAALYQLSLLPEGTQLSIKEIASRANTPQRFLEQILLSLRKNALLRSTKGIHGGYSLCKPLAQITLKEIVLILESSIDPIPCKTNHPLLNHFWKERYRETLESLDISLDVLHTYPTVAISEETTHIKKKETDA